MKTGLTLENYSQGFLVDEEFMAGVTAHPDSPGNYVAFILRHTTGEYVGYQLFPDVKDAIAALNQHPREWTFEAVGGCGGGSCGSGSCGKGQCGAGQCGQGSCPT